MISLPKLCRAAVCLAYGLATLAQAADRPQHVPDPSDPSAAVPPPALTAGVPYRSLPAQSASPDQNWRALNQTVGAINSMSLTMGRAAPDEPAPPPPPAHGQPSAPAPAPMEHHHHGG
jgi:hypothetical protein